MPTRGPGRGAAKLARRGPVGMQCGGAMHFGVTANPGVDAPVSGRGRRHGEVFRTTEVRDAVHLLTPRAANEDVGDALIREMAWYDGDLARGQADRTANTTPGNTRRIGEYRREGDGMS